MAMDGLLEFRSREIQQTLGNEDAQPEVIKTLEAQKIGWFHFKVVIVSGIGFFCESYDLFAISFLIKTLGRIYFPDISYYSPEQCTILQLTNSSSISGPCGSNYYLYALNGISPEEAVNQVPSGMSTNVQAAILACALVGTLLGQIAFGYLGDKYGRRPMFALSLAILIFGALAQGMSFGSTAPGVISTLCIWRLVLGFGIGGDFPLCSTYVSEFSSKQYRGAFIAAVFAMSGAGLLVAALVTMTVASCFSGYPGSADYMWRTCLMLGAVPAAATMYWRLALKESPRFTLYARKDVTQANADMSEMLQTQVKKDTLVPKKRNEIKPKYKEIFQLFRWQIFGTAVCWFLLDIGFYSQTLFQAEIYTDIGWLLPDFQYDPISEAYAIARANVIISIVSVIPGYVITIFAIEWLGRVKLQTLGFTMMTAMMLILTAAYRQLVMHGLPAFVVIYSIGFLFSSMCAGTTFVVPSELYPTVFRSTGHGFSAACGRTGAIIGVFGFGNAVAGLGLQGTLGILVVVNFLGLCTTYFIPETKHFSLEQLSGDAVMDGTELFQQLHNSTSNFYPDTPATPISSNTTNTSTTSVLQLPVSSI